MLLKRLARRSGRSKSDILREALNRMAAEPETASENDGPWSLISDLIGVVGGHTAVRAREHKQAYREALAKKHRR
jgi:hypothetical protein